MYIKYLEDKVKIVVQSSIRRNTFMVHTDYLLLGILFDSLKHIQSMASKKIEKDLQTKFKEKRVFKPHMLILSRRLHLSY